MPSGDVGVSLAHVLVDLRESHTPSSPEGAHQAPPRAPKIRATACVHETSSAPAPAPCCIADPVPDTASTSTAGTAPRTTFASTDRATSIGKSLLAPDHEAPRDELEFVPPHGAPPRARRRLSSQRTAPRSCEA